MDFEFFSKNGEIRPIQEAVIPLSNIEYSYGFGVYENIRAQEGIPYFLKDHVERLQISARIIGLDHRFDAALVETSVTDLIRKSGSGTYNLKVLLIGAKDAAHAALYVLALNPHFPDKKLYRDGARFLTYEYERPFPHAKTLNMLESYLAYKKAREADCYDTLLINSKGCITEGTRTNFFCMRDRTLFTPPESEILLGVTRKAVVRVASENGFSIKEGEISFSYLSQCDGALVTSTSSKILPVRQIDSLSLPPMPAALQELTKAFDAFLSDCRGILTS